MSTNMKILFITLVILLICPRSYSFESLLDNDYYSINWKGPLQLSKNNEPLNHESIIVTTTNKEKYQCMLPLVDSYAHSKESFSSAKLELEFLRPIFDSNVCTYRLELYWTYEFCYGKHVRQYHEKREPARLPEVQEYYLGRFTKDKFYSDLNKAKQNRDKGEVVRPEPKIKKVQGMDMPYFEVMFEGGTVCDLTDKPRRSHMQFVCSTDGRGEIYELKETSSCEYEIVVLTNYLCQHPSYGPKKDPIHSIDCHSLQGSPRRPLNLEISEVQNTLGRYKNKEDEELSDHIWDVVKAYVGEIETEIKGNAPTGHETVGDTDDVAATDKEVEATLQQNANRDRFEDPAFKVSPSSKQILIDFFKGDYCIHGGSDWWKHEFCYGKYVRQYHDGPNGRDTITLGMWDKHNHIDWLKKNPVRQPKSSGERKSIYNYYGDGSFCKDSGKNRYVEVRFDCAKNTEKSNSISLYLLENATCEYKLIVEASLFCDVILKADNDGIINFNV